MPRNESSPQPDASRRRRRFRWLLGCAALVVVVGARIALPALAQRNFERAVQKALGLPVRITDVDLSLLGGGITFEGVGIGGEPVPLDTAAATIADATAFVHWDDLHGNLEWSALLAGRVHLADLILEGAVVRVEQTADGTLQPLALLAAGDSSEPDDSAQAVDDDGEAWPVRVDRLEIRNLRFHIVDPAPDTDPLDFTLDALVIDALVVDGPRIGFGNIALHGPTLRMDRDFSWLEALSTPSDSADADAGPGSETAASENVAAPDTEAAAEPETAGDQYDIDRFDIRDAQFVLVMASRPLDAALTLRAKHATAASGKTFPLRIDLAIEDGSLTAKGRVGLNPPSFDGQIEWSQLPVPIFVLAAEPTIASWVRKCSASGNLTVRASFGSEPGVDGSAGIRFNGHLFVRNLSLADPAAGEVAIDWNELEVVFDESTIPLTAANDDPQPVQIALKRVRLDTPRVRYTHPASAFGAPSAAVAPADTPGDDNPPPAAAAPADTPEGENPPPTAAAPGKPGDDQPLAVRLSVASVELSNGQFDFIDNTVSPSYQTEIAALDIRTGQLRWPDLKIDELSVSATAPGDTTLSLKGDVGLERTDLAIEIDQLPLAPFSPYLQTATGLAVLQGIASITSTVALGRSPSEAGNQPGQDAAPADTPGAIRFNGRMFVKDLSLADPSGEELTVDWNALELLFDESTIPLASESGAREPIRIALERLRLDTPRLHYTLPTTALARPDAAAGSTGAAGSEAQPATATATEPDTNDQAPTVRLSLGRLELSSGQLSFTDHTVKPSFDSGVTALNVHTGQLRWPALEIADLSISGAAPEEATFSVTGDVGSERAEIAVEIDKLALQPFSPYMKAMGFVASKGNASLRSKIELRAPRYNASNKLSLYGLNVDTVDADVAQSRLGMPLDLAIVLLRDPRGKITLSVPISGDETGTDANLGSIMAGALRQALVSAATSPLKMVGMVGSVVPRFGKDGALKIDPIASIPGREEPVAEANVSLGAIAKLLTARPLLAVSLRGRTGPADRVPLAEQILLERLESGEDLPEVEGAGWRSKRRIRGALEARGRGEPTDLDADDQSLYDTYVATVDVSSKRMHGLAGRRASQIQSMLMEQLGVEPERVRLGRPAPPGDPGVLVQLVAAAP